VSTRDETPRPKKFGTWVPSSAFLIFAAFAVLVAQYLHQTDDTGNSENWSKWYVFAGLLAVAAIGAGVRAWAFRHVTESVWSRIFLPLFEGVAFIIVGLFIAGSL
jgi:hypothetical protein